MTLQKIMNVLFVFIFYGVNAQENKRTFKELFKPSLVIEMDAAYNFKEKNVQKNEIILKPEFSYKINKASRLVVKGQIYTELNDNLEAGTPKQETVSNFSKRLFIGDRTDLELRELYLYTKLFRKLRLTLGKQQIVWGETDGLKLLDVLNPQNFRAFILDDFEDSRIPLWSVKTEFDIKTISVQLSWIPDNTYHITQDLEAPFFTKSLFQLPPEGVSTVFNPTVRPKRFILDSDIGIRLSTFTKGWDITLSYFYYYDDLPVFYSNVSISNTGEPTVFINPEFKRQQLVGTTFNKVVGSSTLRGEMAYVFNQKISSIHPDAFRGIATSDVYKSAIGLDYVKGETITSMQLFTDVIVDKILPFNRDKLETNTSLLVSREMMNDNLKLEALWVHNLNHGDGLVRPKISYWLKSNTQLFLSSDVFYGAKSKLFGQFKHQNRLSIGLKWGL